MAVAQDERTGVLPIDAITVGARRRMELGDITELATSIKRVGLLHPIIVDEVNVLVVGERRLRACQQLGWTEIPVRFFQSLSLDERRVIELEENLRRKDLTAYEQSRTIVEMAETAKEVEQNDLLLDSNSKSRGRPVDRTSDKQIAERIGIPQPTISEARAHLRAVEEFPETKDVPQRTALDYAAAARKEPEVRQSPESVEQVAQRERERKAEARKRADDERRTSDALMEVVGDANGNIARARLAEAYARAHHQFVTRLLALDPVEVAAVLDEADRDLTRQTIKQARAWLDTLEAQLTEHIQLVPAQGDGT